MAGAWGGGATRKYDVAAARARAAESLHGRRDRVLEKLEPAGSVTVLIGDPGRGKGYLAERSAHALADRLGRPVEVLVLPMARPEGGVASILESYLPETARVDDDTVPWARRLRERFLELADGRELVLVAPDADECAPWDLSLLSAVCRGTTIRLIVTARRVTRDIDRLRRGRSASTLSIGPLELEESQQVLCALLGVDRIEAGTLRRWHDASGGNSYGLAALAVANDQAGRVRRARGAAWVVDDEAAIEVPSSYAQLIAASSNDDEWRMLEFVAIAEPIGETALLSGLDTAVLATLLHGGLVVSRDRGSRPFLQISHPLFSASIRASMAPARREELNALVFEILDRGRGHLDPMQDPERLMRLVAFGTAAGRDLPIDWLWAAFTRMARAGDPVTALRLAVAVASHPGAEVPMRGTALVRATRLARLLGEDATLRAQVERIDDLLSDPDAVDLVDERLRRALETTALRERVWAGEPGDEVLGEIAELLEGDGGDRVAAETLRSTRLIILMASGRLREALEHIPGEDIHPDLRVEWARSPARASRSILLAQQGDLEGAIDCATKAHMLSKLGTRARSGASDLHGFAWMLAEWASGDATGLRDALQVLTTELSTEDLGEVRASGLMDTAEVLLALLESRWADADEQAERLLARLKRADSYCVSPFVCAARGLALAVLGEGAAATRLLRAAIDPRPGLTRAMAGFRDVLILRAKLWIDTADAVEFARSMADDWQREGFPLIEVQARHVIAAETVRAPRGEIARVLELASALDNPIGDAIRAHMDRLVQLGDEDGEIEPEIRLLAELGLWLPVSTTVDLTPREREIALIAGLGYSSKFISERLHISTRTVEHHLGNVFAKLGIDKRDDLREWAARLRSDRRARNR
ncbi:LuxR C-terminal-related transcriptional regulator [Leucobacter luti]|uniref:helix-turn-helix transcriptional regulator n=1 Tax=Leucobacter luti TaxID=340320 RepID=UPI003D07D598